jgi:hypothetical protein
VHVLIHVTGLIVRGGDGIIEFEEVILVTKRLP